MLAKVVYAGANSPSFEQAARNLKVLAEVTVTVKQVERLTERIGEERVAQRAATTAAYQNRPLVQRENQPPGVQGPDVAVVEFDGGRLQIRDWGAPVEEKSSAAQDATAEPAASPAEPVAKTAEPDEAPRPSKPNHWREDKVGCLLGMSSTVSNVDPCPEIPSAFVEPLKVLALAQGVGKAAVPQGAAEQAGYNEAGRETKPGKKPSRPGQPEVETRRVVASRLDIYGFGPVLAALACAMGLFGATRRAFVADGSSENWSMWKRYFPRWVGVLDFVHAMTYVYKAAMAARTAEQGWPVYERWIRWVWGGEVSRVIEEVTARQQEVGEATETDKEGSLRRVIHETRTYLSNHKDKMRYDEYRKQGLPLMSSHVESTIKQINYRVKGTEKFWSEEGAEAILQLRADYLSDDEPMEDFWQRRQAAATGQRRYRRAA